ncbi:hypothetical protein [Paenibacillus pectinilyticus]|nr:hypothetical protein [Paenibacillus pectinilyticus]
MKGKAITVLEPINVPYHLWFAEPVIESRSVLANAEGFAFMRDLMLIAAQYKENNVMYYVPRPRLNEDTPAMAREEIKSWYMIGEFDLDLVMFNFHYLHIRSKDIKKAIKASRYLTKTIVGIEPVYADLHVYKERFEHWQLKNLLHTKSYSKTLIINADRDVLLYLSYQADGFTHLTNDVKHNFDAHSHADDIGTSVENGLNFFYYFTDHAWKING